MFWDLWTMVAKRIKLCYIEEMLKLVAELEAEAMS